MLFIFWQNILSIHQSAFLRNLSEIHDVILVAEEKIDKERIKHGWHIPDFGKTQVITSPDNQQITKLLDKENAIHIFTGIQSFKMPSEVFRLAVKKKLKIGVITEPYNWLGIKGKLRFLKNVILRMKYGKQIDFILAIGNRGRWCFEISGFEKAKIYDWAYFVETPAKSSLENATHDQPAFLFVGSIDKRKNILPLISICKKVGIIDQLKIIGSGPLEAEMQQNIANTNCVYLGRKFNEEVNKLLTDADLLILPSIFDGWGAIVNEALMCGTPVIVSDHCGSSTLIDGIRGRIFSIKKDNLAQVLTDFIEYLPYDTNKRTAIANWASTTISGEVAADYFNSIISYIIKKTTQKPVAPWMK